MPSKEERMRMCIVRWCTREVTSTVSKKWLIRLRKKLNAKKVRALFEQNIIMRGTVTDCEVPLPK